MFREQAWIVSPASVTSRLAGIGGRTRWRSSAHTTTSDYRCDCRPHVGRLRLRLLVPAAQEQTRPGEATTPTTPCTPPHSHTQAKNPDRTMEQQCRVVRDRKS